MKTWFASSLLWLAGAATAATPADVVRCLDASDLVCAEEAASTLGEGIDEDVARAGVAFRRAEFDRAVELLERAVKGRPADTELAQELATFKAAADAGRGLAVERRGDVEIRY